MHKICHVFQITYTKHTFDEKCLSNVPVHVYIEHILKKAPYFFLNFHLLVKCASSIVHCSKFAKNRCALCTAVAQCVCVCVCVVKPVDILSSFGPKGGELVLCQYNSLMLHA